jgi:ribosomal protein S18 acetylase RimI-like enzyme
MKRTRERFCPVRGCQNAQIGFRIAFSLTTVPVVELCKSNPAAPSFLIRAVHEPFEMRSNERAGPVPRGEAHKKCPRPPLQMAVSAFVALALTASDTSAVRESSAALGPAWAFAGAGPGAALRREGRDKVGEGQRLARCTNCLCAQDRTVYIRASRLAPCTAAAHGDNPRRWDTAGPQFGALPARPWGLRSAHTKHTRSRLGRHMQGRAFSSTASQRSPEPAAAAATSLRIADADDIQELAWVVTDVFVSQQWGGPLQRQVTWVQRQRMWMNVFLSMLTRVVAASFFAGLDIAEEAARSGVSCDAVEQAAPPGVAGARLSKEAAHALFVASVAVGGKEVAAGVVEVSCRPYPVPEGRTQSEWGAEKRPYISNLAVREEFRGRGLAKALMAKVEDHVLTWGFPDVVLDTNCDNLVALQLYQCLGYVTELVEPPPRKVRRAFLRKRLAPSAIPHPPDALTLRDEEEEEEERGSESVRGAPGGVAGDSGDISTDTTEVSAPMSAAAAAAAASSSSSLSNIATLAREVGRGESGAASAKSGVAGAETGGGQSVVRVAPARRVRAVFSEDQVRPLVPRVSVCVCR